MAATPDLTLDEVRHALADEVAVAAVFDGWSEAAVTHAAGVKGIDPQVARIAFSGSAMAMIEAWVETTDDAMRQALPKTVLDGLPVRERIRRLVEFRLGKLAGKEEAVTRALGVMAMPHHAARALKLGWRSADLMWRLAGDTATDHNHYTKRSILAGIYAATLGVFAQDTSENKAETHAFLARRIDGVIRFEKAKARWQGKRNERFSMTRFLGRLRYPAS